MFKKTFLTVAFVASALVLTGCGKTEAPQPAENEKPVAETPAVEQKAPAEQKELLFVDIDDFALNELGEWPWSRDKIADCLLTMREVGAKTAVFDIEYLSPSSKSIDYNLIEKIKQNPDAADQISQIFIDNDDYFARAVQFFGNTFLTVNNQDLGYSSITEDDINYIKNCITEIEKHWV